MELEQLQDSDVVVMKCPLCKEPASERKIKIIKDGVNVLFKCQGCDLMFTVEYFSSRVQWLQDGEKYIMWKYWLN